MMAVIPLSHLVHVTQNMMRIWLYTERICIILSVYNKGKELFHRIADCVFFHLYPFVIILLLSVFLWSICKLHVLMRMTMWPEQNHSCYILWRSLSLEEFSIVLHYFILLCCFINRHFFLTAKQSTSLWRIQLANIGVYNG